VRAHGEALVAPDAYLVALVPDERLAELVLLGPLPVLVLGGDPVDIDPVVLQFGLNLGEDRVALALGGDQLEPALYGYLVVLVPAEDRIGRDPDVGLVGVAPVEHLTGIVPGEGQVASVPAEALAEIVHVEVLVAPALCGDQAAVVPDGHLEGIVAEVVFGALL
jgi:hypothetical protein